MIKFILIFISMFTMQVHAFEFETVKRAVAQDSLSAERSLLMSIASCLKEKKADHIVKCARPFMSEKLEDRDVRKIMYWFSQNIKITSLNICPHSVVEFIPSTVKLDSKKILCGDYSLEGLDKQSLFFIGFDSQNKLKLVNLRP